jgi:ABC-type sugar transport system permease subunit
MGTAVLLLLPLFVLVVCLIAYPFYRAVWLSFTDKLVGYPERWVSCATISISSTTTPSARSSATASCSPLPRWR